MPTKNAYKLLFSLLFLSANGCKEGLDAPHLGSTRGAVMMTPNPTSDNAPTGVVSTFSVTGGVDSDPATNPFFASLGQNGRACGSCHKQDQAWSISSVQVQAMFNDSDGLDPLFRLVDGANSPCANVSTLDARMEAYSLLLQRGLIRVGDDMAVPASGNFTVSPVCDPYGYVTQQPTLSCPNPLPRFSLFRRPLPSAGLAFLSELMWDGRESKYTPATTAAPERLDLSASLLHQANGATRGHAQATSDISPVQAKAMADFQTSIFTSQRTGQGIGTTQAQGALGSPEILSTAIATIGNPTSMTLYDAWTNVANPHRQAVARGQALFNRVVPAGRCSGCHNDTNVGNRVQTRFFRDLGLSDVDPPNDGTCATGGGLPIYRVTCTDVLAANCKRTRPNGTVVGAVSYVTDLGQGLISGSYADIGKFKVPVLRGMAARAPFFHNGAKGSLLDVVRHYNEFFNLGLTEQEMADLVAFLQAL